MANFFKIHDRFFCSEDHYNERYVTIVVDEREYEASIHTSHYQGFRAGPREPISKLEFEKAKIRALEIMNLYQLPIAFETKDKPEYLLCAAIRRVEERDCPKVYWEQFHDIYKIEIGWRHPDIMHRFGKEVSRNPNDQGFYTSKGRFVTREEGLEIARAAGQVDKIIGGVLTSEDLY